MFTPKQLKIIDDPGFLAIANARFFQVGDTDEMIVDTLDLHILGLPEVQFHFRGLNPNNVVGLEYDIAMYQFQNDLPIKEGETIGGFGENGRRRKTFAGNASMKCL